MKKVIKQAFLSTLPVMAGYIVLGFGFGIILKTNGHSILLAFAMSFLIYAGSMQYVALELLSSGASYIVIALTTLMVNAQHLFTACLCLIATRARARESLISYSR